MSVPPNLSSRRFDLDWLRIIAFGLLIFYHMGMFFVSWDWHVKSQHAGPAIQPLMLLTSPWRLALLFLIAGCATRMPRGAMARLRSGRLLLPLLFGMFVVVPPQTYYEIVEKLSFAEGWLAFYMQYATGQGDWRPGGQRLIVPTWNHLWFVAYLWVYTMLVIALRPVLVSAGARRLGAWLAGYLSGPGLIIWPALLLIAFRVVLRPIFGQTHALLDDWYLHAVYFSLFLFGFCIAKADAVWAAIDRLRRPALLLALGSYAGLAWIMASWPLRGDFPAAWIPARDALWAFDQWIWILALLGLAQRLLNHDGPVRRYLTDAVFPLYILHQTVIVVTGHHLRDLGLSAWGEAGIILAATLGLGLGGTEIIRRLRWLRPLFGLKGAAAAPTGLVPMKARPGPA
jgi:glucans biosynthesis protein C